ncbi:CHRD domain-containing protein [Actinotalea sp. AC32]|nr:CHRD domain-containing protein [Actinotalea sp. AC32]
MHHRTRLVRPTVAVVAAAAACVALASPAAAVGGRPFTVELTGAAEVPGPGDPDGSGTATLTVNPGRGEVCWSIDVSDIADPLAAHIHVGAVDVAGPVVVPLDPNAPGCATVDRELAREIVRDPSAYYVNVHNAEYPAGAVRGQLDR